MPSFQVYESFNKKKQYFELNNIYIYLFAL